MVPLECEEFQLLLSLFLVDFSTLRNPLLDRLNARLELENLVLLAGALSFLGLNNRFEVSLTMFSLLLLAHGEGDGALVEGLIGLAGHLDIVTNPQQQQATLWLVQGNLTDQFVEAFAEELLAHWADSS